MAPLSGRIGRHLVSVGNLVQPDQTELTTIVATDPIHFYFDIDERRLLDYANAAHKNDTYLQEGAGGLKVVVRLADERSPTFSGTLDFAENSIDPETGTLRARARFANPSHTLQPGLFGHVEIEASSPYEAILIPDEAVAADQNERIVYVLDADSTIRSVPVQLGSKIYGYRVVQAGLKGDERVVVGGVVRVRPGAKVNPVHTELPLEIRSDVPASSAAATVTNKAVR
ncbi:efflux RND transporter periplasmic adaptor subunit [Rhizobium sp. NTR19]|uniref:Efflux RND transporter periplasmic adaptor subunit n=1 Tax=Neorhizobium turbinariae TaxID=2937795 RepID=A0ABT0IXP0_9HYPH|nr:efflux RND transporter periplasmic adaptor subunit [Neorhizobium turbinariae]MCK8782604.1 efflux RND transporter periplasmic adaptor subunit [Neorhizobium turbinariae]